MNKGSLFATTSWEIKSHAVESQITLLVWPYLNHLQKNIKQLITWSFLMIQSVNFTSAAFEAFAETYLKKYASENKIYFCPRKKSNVWLTEKVTFVFHTIFILDFITQIINCIINICLCSHLILFLFSYISL